MTSPGVVRLSTNAAYTLSSQALVAVVGVICAPVVLRNAGIDALGILSLAWLVLAYMPLVDIGLGRAVTFYTAAPSEGESQINRRALFLAALAIQMGFTGALALICWLVAPWLAQDVLTLPVALQNDSVLIVKLLTIGSVIASPTSILVGTLAGHQRFDLIAHNKLLVNGSLLIWPALASTWSEQLVFLVAPLLLIRLVGNILLFKYCGELERGLRQGSAPVSSIGSEAQRLMSFAGWVGVSNLLQIVLAHGDKLLISGLLAISAFGYYAVVQDTLTKLSVIPTAVATVLFAYLPTVRQEFEQQRLSLRAAKYINLLMWPICLLIFTFADVLLKLWMGVQFSDSATTIARIVCVGVWINALSYAFVSLLYGRGRADVVAKIHLAEVPVYAIVLWLLSSMSSLEAIAIAWAIRIAIDAAAMFLAAIFRQHGALNGLDVSLVLFGGLAPFGMVIFTASVPGRWLICFGALLTFFVISVRKGGLVAELRALSRARKQQALH